MLELSVSQVQLAAVDTAASGAGATGEIEAYDIQKSDSGSLLNFRQLMATENVDTVKSIETVNATENSLGDKLLNGMHGLNEGFNSSLDSVEKTLNKVEITPQEIMSAQVELLKFGLQNELVNKVVSKSTQNLDSMVKSQ